MEFALNKINKIIESYRFTKNEVINLIDLLIKNHVLNIVIKLKEYNKDNKDNKEDNKDNKEDNKDKKEMNEIKVESNKIDDDYFLGMIDK